MSDRLLRTLLSNAAFAAPSAVVVRRVALAWVALASVGAAVAQSPTPAGLPVYDSAAAGEVLPLPGGTPITAGGQPITTSGAPMATVVPTPPEVLPPGDLGGYAPLSMTLADALPMACEHPAITESSGTWLRRGLWYADVDAVVMARTWDSIGVTLAQEFDLIVNINPNIIGTPQFPQVLPIQQQGLGESSPGYDASARLALGRFLFRDQSNRDHTVEMVVFGGAEWQDQMGAEAQLLGPAVVNPDGSVTPAQGVIRNNVNAGFIDGRGLQVPRAIDGSEPLNQDSVDGFPSFDGADAMTAEYASRMHSWEWNYTVSQRMGKDRMELLPSGHWVRRASSGITFDYIAGLRYVDIEERLDWLATGIGTPGATGTASDQFLDARGGDDGTYLIDTSNNLFGIQLGGGITYDTDRWNASVSLKNGFLINDARATSNLQFTDGVTGERIAGRGYDEPVDLHENGVSYLLQGAIVGRYHLRPNLSLRAGWEFMFVTGVALAPNQADFNGARAQLDIPGDIFYHGISLGTEYYW